jgi:hypothetical protein
VLIPFMLALGALASDEISDYNEALEDRDLGLDPIALFPISASS